MRGANGDRRVVLWSAAGLLVAVLLASWLTPNPVDVDPTPTTYNTGVAGVRAVYLLLSELGYTAERWDEGVAGWKDLDAARTTLVLAEPQVPETQVEEVKGAVADFLGRGGRVVATGVAGAYLLPGATTKSSSGVFKGLCLTTPEGQGALARAGAVSMPDTAAWGDAGVKSRVEQRCGTDAVVVEYRVGAGRAVWWASALPMTNRGVREDGGLKLVLASVGEPGRRVVFDETFHGAAASIWDTAKGLPVRALAIQTGVVAVLLVLSFGRRSGPVLDPVAVVRSSPLEFAESMGHLYQKAGATAVATEGARRRVMRFLGERCGVPAGVLSGAGDGVVEAVQGRLGGEWRGLGEHLNQSAGAEHESLARKSALRLVKALDEDLRRLKERISSRREREME